jgi:hypothetical protein
MRLTTTPRSEAVPHHGHVSKSRGEHIDPSSSRLPVQMFAESWLRSKQLPMAEPSHYITLERAQKNEDLDAVATGLNDQAPWMVPL